MKKGILRQCLSIAKNYNNKGIHPERANFMHFSFIIVDNKILSMGLNKRGEPLILKGYSEINKIHAETEAFYKAKGVLNNKPYTCINIRLLKSNSIRLSKPCDNCYRFLSEHNCKEVYFTLDNGKFKLMRLYE